MILKSGFAFILFFFCSFVYCLVGIVGLQVVDDDYGLELGRIDEEGENDKKKKELMQRERKEIRTRAARIYMIWMI